MSPLKLLSSLAVAVLVCHANLLAMGKVITPKPVAVSVAPPVAAAKARLGDSFKMIQFSDLPDFSEDVEERVTKSGKVHVHGLVSTINFKEFKKVKLQIDEELVELTRSETNFNDDLEINVLWQPKKAPLAILLLGFYQEHDQKLARAWQSYLYEAGCHVLIFDSIFRHELNEMIGHGISGNMVEDAKAITRIVNAFLKHKESLEAPGTFRDRISSIRLLGASYGGILALHVLKRPEAKDWNIDRVLTLSAPVRTHTAAKRLDFALRYDRPRYEFWLIKLFNGYTPKSYPPAKWEESLMRAGLAYDFQGDLEDAIEAFEELYLKGLFDEFEKLENAPDLKIQYESRVAAMKKRHKQQARALKGKFKALIAGKKLSRVEKKKHKKEKKLAFTELEVIQKIEENTVEKRLSDPEYWSFNDFVDHMSAPYWNITPKQLWAQGDLGMLLKDTPDFVQAVLAKDDPLNDEAELDELRNEIKDPKLLVLPYGGHLGFTGTVWLHKLLLKFFNAHPPAVDEAESPVAAPKVNEDEKLEVVKENLVKVQNPK